MTFLEKFVRNMKRSVVNSINYILYLVMSPAKGVANIYGNLDKYPSGF